MRKDNITYYRNLELIRKKNVVLYILNDYFPKPEIFRDLHSKFSSSPFPFTDFEQTHPLDLPVDVIICIFEFCNKAELKMCSESCKLFYNATRAKRVWSKFGIVENQDISKIENDNGLLFHVCRQKERLEAMKKSLEVFEEERKKWYFNAIGSFGGVTFNESFFKSMMSEFQKTFHDSKAEHFLFEKAYNDLKIKLEKRIQSKEIILTRDDITGKHIPYGYNTECEVDMYRIIVDFNLKNGTYKDLNVKIYIKCKFPYPHGTFEIYSKSDIFHPLFNNNEHRSDNYFNFDVYVGTVGSIMGELGNNQYLEKAFETVEKCLIDPKHNLDYYRCIRNTKANLALSDDGDGDEFRKFLLKSFGKKKD